LSVTGVRDLVFSHSPFVLGTYPERPAPAHVINGFLAASLGTSARAGAIRVLLASNARPPREFRFFDGTRWDGDHFLDGVDWARDPAKLAALRSDLGLVFNPDRRMWAEFGSPVPVHAGFVGSDPSDDRFGPLVWEIVRRYAPEDYGQILEALFSPSEAHDCVTAAALVLAKGGSTEARRTVSVMESSWFASGGSPAGQFLARRLTEFVVNLTENPENPENPGNAHRLMQIQHLARGLYLVALLAVLLGPIAAASEQGEPSSTDSIASMVAWAGTPPGPAGSPIVMAAARAFQVLLERNRAGLAAMLLRGMQAQILPAALPPSQRRRAAARGQLLQNGVPVGRVDDILNELSRDAGVDLEDESVDDPIWASQIIESAYASDRLTRGLRSMGRKIGFIGPDRGAGAPRFVCETPLLGTLVAGLCPRGGIDLYRFVDLAREHLGIVFGLGSQDNLAEQLGLWDGAGVGRQLLRENEEALRRRLIRAGLAREYSDGHTEVVRDD
jgi:hypothetical protein